MRRLGVLLFLAWVVSPAWGEPASELAVQIREAGVDAEACYRVRDLAFTREDIRFFFTEGYLAFGKPVAGRRRAAVFLSGEDEGDAELVVFPPTRGERMALARATKSPNLSEHFGIAVMVFSDDTYDVLMREIEQTGEPRKSPEMGLLMEKNWNDVVRNLTTSFLVRLLEDTVSAAGPAEGFFFCTLRGDQLGNFDILYDLRRTEQILIGKVGERKGMQYFDTWTSFPSRSFRNKARTPPEDGFELSNFRLNAVLNPDLTLAVTTKVTLTPTRDSLRVAEFLLSPRMRLTAASIDGAAAEFFQRESLRENLMQEGATAFLLIPAAPLELGRRYELEFQADGTVIQSSGNNVYFVGARECWYPNVEHQTAAYDVQFRYPAELDLVLPGEVVGAGTEGSLKYKRHRISTPVRFVGFNLGDYQRAEVTRGPYHIEVYANKKVEPGLEARSRTAPRLVHRMVYDPRLRRVDLVQVIVSDPVASPAPEPQVQQLAQEIANAFEFMAARFGPPPLRNLTVSPIPGTFGQGFPGLVYLSTTAYLKPEERPPALANDFHQTFFSDLLHAHEIAHQWWGNTVSARGAEDAWLVEALANYSALLYLEKRRGTRALDSVLEAYRKRLLAETPEGRTKESIGPIVWGGRLLSSEAPDAIETIVYEKGSWILHMLRKRLGDDRFTAMLAELAKTYNRREITTEQFRLLAAKFQPPGSPDPALEVFFQNWVYATGIPTLALKTSSKGKGQSYTVSGTVTQSGVDEEFTAWVPVEIQFRSGKPVVHWVKTDSEPVEFSVSVKQPPVRVVLDPGGSVLALRK
jgi:hypothetical protein